MDKEWQWPDVPSDPEQAQLKLFVLLGRAIASCQVAEGRARSLHELLQGHPAPGRSTLGRTVNNFAGALPSDVAARYRDLVRARNYLAHEVLFDCGGWAGHPLIDSPGKFDCLYGKIGEAQQTITEVQRVIDQHMTDTNAGFLRVDFGPDGPIPMAPQSGEDSC